MGRLTILAGLLALAVLAPHSSAHAADADPGGPMGLVILAEKAEARGDSRMAVALYQRAHEAFPATAEPLTGWGLLAARLGAMDEAAILLAAALDIEPDNIAATAGLADVLVDLDRPDEALVLYDAVLEADPSDIAARDGRLYVLALIAAPARIAIPSTLATATESRAPDHPSPATTLIETASPPQPDAATAVWR